VDPSSFVSYLTVQDTFEQYRILCKISRYVLKILLHITCSFPRLCCILHNVIITIILVTLSTKVSIFTGPHTHSIGGPD